MSEQNQQAESLRELKEEYDSVAEYLKQMPTQLRLFADLVEKMPTVFEASMSLAEQHMVMHDALQEATLRMKSLGQDTSQQEAALAEANGGEQA